jgi:hypothetical protein
MVSHSSLRNLEPETEPEDNRIYPEVARTSFQPSLDPKQHQLRQRAQLHPTMKQILAPKLQHPLFQPSLPSGLEATINLHFQLFLLNHRFQLLPNSLDNLLQQDKDKEVDSQLTKDSYHRIQFQEPHSSPETARTSSQPSLALEQHQPQQLTPLHPMMKQILPLQLQHLPFQTSQM